jgi:hypothetical protein
MAAPDSTTLTDQAEQELEGLEDQAGADVAQGMYALCGHFAMQGSVMQIPPSMLQDAGNEATDGGPELSRRDQSHDARRSQTADVTLAAYSAGIARYQDFSISIGGEEMDAEELENYSENILENKEDVREELEAKGYSDAEIQEFFQGHKMIIEALRDGRLSKEEIEEIQDFKEEHGNIRLQHSEQRDSINSQDISHLEDKNENQAFNDTLDINQSLFAYSSHLSTSTSKISNQFKEAAEVKNIKQESEAKPDTKEASTNHDQVATNKTMQFSDISPA